MVRERALRDHFSHHAPSGWCERWRDEGAPVAAEGPELATVVGPVCPMPGYDTRPQQNQATVRRPAHLQTITVENMTDVISTHGLSKTYGGRAVVDRLDLAVPEGCVYGFLGPNGSGKTTTMKMLLSLVRPTKGDVTILGRPMTRQTRRQVLGDIGSLIEAPPAYGHLTGAENLRIVRHLLDVPQDQVDEAVRTVRLEEHMGKLVKNYSLGMKQRLGIAMALVRRPKLLVLDEPTNGLDPAGIDEIRRLLTDLAGRGVTVMVSSHLLVEIERMATVLGILARGRLLFQGTRAELMARTTPDLLVETPEADRAAELLRSARASRTAGAIRVPGLDQPGTARLVAHLAAHDIPIYGVRRDTQTLEDVFMDLTGGGGL